MGKIESLLTSVVRPYSFIVTDGEGIQYRRDVHVAQHTAAGSSVNEQEFHILHFPYKNSYNSVLKLVICIEELQSFYIFSICFDLINEIKRGNLDMIN